MPGVGASAEPGSASETAWSGRIKAPSAARPGLPSPLSDRDFSTFRALIADRTGISLGPHKRALLQSRLGSRLRALGLATFTEYRRVLTEQDPGGQELDRFINAVTTNKTGFYREARHFTYLAEHWVPAARKRAERTGRRMMRLWSAGCSSGEEPYTIAMTIAEGLEGTPGWNVRILASDINTEVLDRAASAIYTLDDVRALPRAVLARHFLQGRGSRSGLVRLHPALRQLVTFRRLNLIDEGWPFRARFDVIFCRNVLIYFDRPTQQRVLERLMSVLEDGGTLVLGHSESVTGLVSGLRHVASTIYQKEVDHAGHHPHR